MAHNARITENNLGTGVQPISGAAPLTLSGNAAPVSVYGVDSLSATVYLKLTTNALAVVPQWEVASSSQGPWSVAKPENNASYVTLATGTGSAASLTVDISACKAVYGRQYARLSLVTSGAAGAGLGADEYSISYNFRHFNQ